MVDKRNAPLSEPHHGPSLWVRGVSLLVALASLPVVLLSRVSAGLTCDEGCSAQPTTWTDDPHAWQWHGQFWLAAFAAVLAWYALFSRRTPNGDVALAVSLLLWAGWLVLMGVA